MAELNKDLTAASATPLVLALLDRSDSYGYALIRDVRLLTDGELEWAEGMLYPILHRLEGKGWISSYWGKSDTGRRRKYYQIEPAGKQELARQREAWKALGNWISSTAQVGATA